MRRKLKQLMAWLLSLVGPGHWSRRLLNVVRFLLAVETRNQAWMVNRVQELAALGHQFAPLYADSEYYVMPKRSWNIVLWCWKRLRLPYTTGRDCDNFSESLRAVVGYVLEINSVAEVWDRNPDIPSSRHAFNIVWFPDGAFEFIEPQTANWTNHGLIRNGVVRV